MEPQGRLIDGATIVVNSVVNSSVRGVRGIVTVVKVAVLIGFNFSSPMNIYRFSSAACCNIVANHAWIACIQPPSPLETHGPTHAQNIDLSHGISGSTYDDAIVLMCVY